jgi:hypothetical protein
MKRIRINIILGLLIAGVYSISDVCGTSPTSSTSAIVDDSYKGPMSQFLRLKGPIKPTETMGIQEFETIDGDSFRSSDYVAFADPTYDQTFKALFTGDVKIDGFCGTDRLMSLLNGIYYPEADSDPNAYKIREITPLDGGTYKCLIKKEGIFS